MTTCELRLKAAEIIEARGWCHGTFELRGAVCIIGAIRSAATGSPHPIYPYERNDEVALDAAVQSMGFKDRGWATSWNDACGRTKADVLAKLREGCQ